MTVDEYHTQVSARLVGACNPATAHTHTKKFFLKKAIAHRQRRSNKRQAGQAPLSKLNGFLFVCDCIYTRVGETQQQQQHHHRPKVEREIKRKILIITIQRSSFYIPFRMIFGTRAVSKIPPKCRPDPTDLTNIFFFLSLLLLFVCDEKRLLGERRNDSLFLGRLSVEPFIQRSNFSLFS